MSAISFTKAQEMLSLWLEAEKNITTAQSYKLDTGGSSRMLTRADLAEVRKSIDYWEAKCNALDPANQRPAASFRTVQYHNRSGYGNRRYVGID